jgi:hypothetical protein
LTAGGKPHHQLTYALDQLEEWKDWFDEPANKQIFSDTYEVPDIFRRRKWEPIWVLVYGRREENPDGVRKLRARLCTRSRIVIPYEHLEPDEDARDYLCVKRTRGRYVAVGVPPTVRLGPAYAEDWALIAWRRARWRARASSGETRW